jgi:squalene-hopene/tetraprenyl-beta-curcumene cyclase
LIEIFGVDDDRSRRAIEWLCNTQLSGTTEEDPAGSWTETEFTGTGFPRVFYLRYHMYRLYFPLMAVARWSAGVTGGGSLESGVEG